MQSQTSWFPIPSASDFSVYNLPYGIFSTTERSPRVGIAIGDHILDLAAVAETGMLDKLHVDPRVLHQNRLNAVIRLGKATTNGIRDWLRKELTAAASPLRDQPAVWVAQTDAQMHLPVEIGDYTDFYSSQEHATNVGKMFRDPANALLPNWKHLPVGYHGRSSSIIPSGVPIRRPRGQVLPAGATQPLYQATERLDFELEMGCVIGQDSTLGQPITTDTADDHIFGLVLFNDWSARDIQKWEYVPLGPFLGKNFASSLSPWIVPLEALAPFRVAGPVQDPAVLPYLSYTGHRNYDIQLEVALQPADNIATTLARSNTRYLYWNMAQQLAHHTVNGCNVRVGDLLATGTISGPTPDSYGSMLELSWGGKRQVQLDGGQNRTFIEDHDTVILRAYAEREDVRVGFGEVRTQVLPAFAE